MVYSEADNACCISRRHLPRNRTFAQHGIANATANRAPQLSKMEIVRSHLSEQRVVQRVIYIDRNNYIRANMNDMCPSTAEIGFGLRYA